MNPDDKQHHFTTWSEFISWRAEVQYAMHGSRRAFIPTPLEIAERAAEVRERWSRAEEHQRTAYPHEHRQVEIPRANGPIDDGLP